MDVRVEASAPSNIALIKYMGKSADGSNLPANPSLSYTLENLRTVVRIEPAVADGWAPLPGPEPLTLSESGRERFLAHFSELRRRWKIPGTYKISSANGFPSDCGLASSASSFAALTRAAYNLARRHDSALSLPESELSRLSRRGSGSSCRSFFSPWALWREEGAEAASLDLKLEHAVVIVESRAKAVSSSLAHRRVETSLLYPGRAERASRRLAELLAALKAVAETADGADAWRAAMEICWSEFWDMHALFETSRPAFGYMTEESSRVLNRLREVWREEGDGPLITMDAGPNVHLLLRPEQTTAAGGWLRGLNSRRSWEAEG